LVAVAAAGLSLILAEAALAVIDARTTALRHLSYSSATLDRFPTDHQR